MESAIAINGMRVDAEPPNAMGHAAWEPRPTDTSKSAIVFAGNRLFENRSEYSRSLFEQHIQGELTIFRNGSRDKEMWY